jgi:hypothetical protein
MIKMKFPGFTAEAALPLAGGRYRMSGNYEVPEGADRILPQLPVTACQHDPDNICRYICCTVKTIGPYNLPIISCTIDWICGHRRPDAGVIYEF